MESLYDFSSVRMMAKEIVNNIGAQNLYTETNVRYRNSPKNFCLGNINVISEYIKKYLNDTSETKKLIIVEDNQVGENIFGLYVHYQNTGYIKINSKLNFCWKRFATLKELCSLYVDHYDTSMTKFDNYLESLKNAFEQKQSFLNSPFIDQGDLDSETFSILLATELMIPIHKREITKGLIAKIGGSEITLNDIAKSLLIPEFILKLYVDKNLINCHPQFEDFGA